MSTSQGMSRTAGKLQELVGRTLLYRSQRGVSSADTLISGLQPPELWDDEFLLFSATLFVVLCYRKASTPVSNFCAVPTSGGDPDFFSEPVLKLSLLEFCQGKCGRGFLPLTKACK